MANEKRLIDANYVENKIRQIISEVQKMRYGKAIKKDAVNYIDEIYKLDNWLGCYAEVLDVVEQAPTVDAVEVVHGRWEQVQRWATKAKYRCSVCGREIMSATKVDIEKYPYCHCGAKMDGDGNDTATAKD